MQQLLIYHSLDYICYLGKFSSKAKISLLIFFKQGCPLKIHSKQVIKFSKYLIVNIFWRPSWCAVWFIQRGTKQLSLISKALLTRIPSCFAVNFDGLLCITFLMGSWHGTPPTSEKRSILLDNPRARSFSSIYLNYILMIKRTFIHYRLIDYCGL